MSSLKDALADGEADTPAGVDLAAVRTRARRLRRDRWAVAGVAALTAAAVAVPLTVLRPDPAPTAPALAAGPLGCPDRLPDSSSEQTTTPAPLVPFEPTGGLLCGYTPGRSGPASTGPLGEVVRLTAARARALADRIDRGARLDGPTSCPAEDGVPFGLQLAGADAIVTLRVEEYGCGVVTDGEHFVYSGGLGDLVGDVPLGAVCPATVSDPARGRGTGDLLPADARRLLLCGYDGRALADRSGRPRIVDTAAAREYVRRLNAAPKGSGICPADLDPRRIVVVAVTPTGTTRAVGRLSGCGEVTDGVTTANDRELTNELWSLSQRTG